MASQTGKLSKAGTCFQLIHLKKARSFTLLMNCKWNLHGNFSLQYNVKSVSNVLYIYYIYICIL